MSHFVLDASVALAWFVDRTIDPYAQHVGLRLQSDDRALVPLLWRIEIANGFVTAERRGTLSSSDINEALERFERLRSQSVDYSDETFPVRRLLATAHQFRLTAYDAEYLETARTHRLPLATLDRRLRQAASQAGIDLLQ